MTARWRVASPDLEYWYPHNGIASLFEIRRSNRRLDQGGFSYAAGENFNHRVQKTPRQEITGP